jgi:hypothetical protein
MRTSFSAPEVPVVNTAAFATNPGAGNQHYFLDHAFL